MAEPRDPDRQARAAVREMLDESLVVEAGAGTGKTHALVDRLEALIGSGRAEIGQIVAITFTRAAAAELRERIRMRFEERTGAAATGDPAVAARLGRAVESLDSAAIQTIDAFALALLRERPLDAGLPPVLDPLDEIQAELAFDDRWTAWLDEALDGDLGARLARAMRLGLERPIESLEQVARAMHDNYDLLRSTPFVDPPRPVRAAARAVLDARDEAHSLLGHARPGKGRKLAQSLRDIVETAARIGRVGAESDEALAVLADAPELGTGRVARDAWGQLSGGADVTEQAVRLVEMLKQRVEGELEQARAAAIAPVLKGIASFVTGYAEERQVNGTPQFHDLLVWAAELVGDPRSAAAAHFRERYRYVLIDEFQDTDPLQTALALSLTSGADGKARPGALFVVGDPKQSIYRFRRADPSSLRRVRAHTSNDPVQLTITRRSHEGIVRWVNAAFGGWMGRGGETAQAPYVDLVSERPAPEEERSGVWTIGGLREGNIGDVRREERARIVEMARSIGNHEWTVFDRSVEGSIPRQSRYGDLCILFPTRVGLDDLERTLEEGGIPYTIEGQTLAYSTQDVRDLVNCVTAIDDPSDEVSIVAALRSPAFGCSDVDLYDWTVAGRRFSYLDLEVTNGPVGDGLAILRRFHDDRQLQPTPLVVERFIRETRLRELALDSGRPRERWRMLSIVVEQARALADAGRGTLRDLVRWCDERRERRERVADGGVAELDVDAVRLMTVHYAKGLEFPIVLLTGLNAQRRTATDPVLFDFSEGLAPARRLAVKLGKFEYGDYANHQTRDRDADELEAVRVAYVAATRARDHLIVSLFRKQQKTDTSLAARLVEEVGEHNRALWRPVEVAGAASAGPGGDDGDAAVATEDTEADRGAWQARRSELIESASRRRSVSATALEADGTTGPMMGPGGEPGSQPVEEDATAREDEPWRRGRGGTAIGRAVHAALQDVDLQTGDGLVEICRRQALAEGLDGGEGAVEVERLARAVIGTDLVRRAASSRHWKEVYVATPVRDDGHRNGGFLEGFVDLVYELPSGELGVIDYKTDALRGGASLDEAARPYRLQLGAYAHSITATSGRAVAEASIVFARLAAAGVPAVYRLPDLTAASRDAASAAASAFGPDAHGGQPGAPRPPTGSDPDSPRQLSLL